MEYNTGVSMILPDSVGLIENDFDDEDHEQKNQKEIVELIMAAFEGHDEPSDGEDDDDEEEESLNSSGSSPPSSDEQQLLNINNNNNTDEQFVQEQDELLKHNHSDEQILFSTPTISTPLPLVPVNNIHRFQIANNQDDIPFNTKNHIIHYQNNNCLSSNTPSTAFHYVPTIDITDPQQAQYIYQTSSTNLNETQNQFRILRNLKDQKISQLQNLCGEYREKYERSKYDWEQKNNQLKDSELRIQQLEAIKTQFEKQFSGSKSISRSQQADELVLSTIREKHEQEIASFNKKFENIQKNLQEKNIEVNELRVQLEFANKNNEKTIFEQIETINHLNEQLRDSQRKYTDLLTSTSIESINHTEIKLQLTHMNENKEKLESKCQELQAEIRSLRERINENEDQVNNVVFNRKRVSFDVQTKFENSLLDESIINENILLKERINEYVYKEKQLREINEDLKYKIQQYEYQSKRSDSSSSSSSNETVITTSFHMEQSRKLSNQIELLNKDYTNLLDKYDYEKQELQTIIEQLREDVNDMDKTKQLYIDVCQEKNTIEDTLRTKFEYELKIKLDDLHQIFEKDKQIIQRKYVQDFEQQSKEFHQEIDRTNIKYEKQIIELNNELDGLRTNDDTKNRLVYVEKEFEELKHDYYDLNIKQSELLKTCSVLENENENLLNSIEQIEKEKLELTQKFENEIKQLNEQKKQELLYLNKQTDQNEINLKENIESLQLHVKNYENVITQYEEYRIKLENNLQKLTQQRDTNKVELRLTKEMLTNKEDDYNQLKIHFEQCEKHLQNDQEQFRQYETTINDLERQIQQYKLHSQEFNQTRLAIIQGTELEYGEKLLSVNTEKCQLEQRLQEANRAVELADSHLKQEIEKIKICLEQEYNRRYERDQKQQSNISLQDIEEIKKMYRLEIDRLYRENIELSQHQSKLIDAHQKQMQIMKKDLDDGYNKVINEFQHEQTRLQTRCDQLKQQLNDGQQIIEQLKLSLNQLKVNHYDEISRVQEAYKNDKYTFEYENRNRQDNFQNRLDHLVKLLEQSSDALNQERTLKTKQENEYQLTINSLQKKISDMIKQQNKSTDELRHELQEERLANHKRIAPRPISVPEFTSIDFSSKDIKSDYLTTVEKLRELFTNEMIALLRLTCKMIFDVHHGVAIAHCMDNLDISVKKQIQNELIQSRNSMIKEIRREILEKRTYVLRSQKVSERTIDMHIYELDRLLSQIVQDCLNSFPVSSPSVSNTSSVSVQIIAQRQQTRFVVSNKSAMPLRKSIECLYMTPSVNKQRAPLAPHCRSTLDIDRRPKSASNIFLASQNCESNNKDLHIKMHKSEDDLISMQRNQQDITIYSDGNDTLTLCENKNKYQQQNVQELTKKFEQKPNSLSDQSKIKSRVIDTQKKENNDDELTWPQQPASIPTSGIKKFVRNSLKLFIIQPQHHKRTGK